MAEAPQKKRSHVLLTIICLLSAVLCGGAAAVFGFNAVVSHGVNDTAQTLKRNIASIDSKNVDLEKLASSQQQVDAQLADAQASTAVQLPTVRTAIAKARSLSATLDKRIKDLQDASSTTSHNATLSNKSDSSQSDSSGGSSTSKDAEKQKKKLEALLKQNETTEQGQDSGKATTTTTPDTSTTKPW
jgi:hypothetical protein